jgi:hypothetical protein
MAVTPVSNEDKLTKIEEFRQWLCDNDVSFVEKQNGHFQIFDEQAKLIFQVWATTERMNVQTSGTKVSGLSIIEKHLEEYFAHSHDNSTPLSVAKELPDIPNGLRAKFITDVENERKNRKHMPFDDCVLITVVQVPTGAKEVIVNHEYIAEKVDYYMKAYDEQFRLKTNSDVRIIGIM